MACCGSAKEASINPDAIVRVKSKNEKMKMKMRRAIQLAATTLLIAATATHAQISSPQIKKDKKQPKESVEWLWQYGPPPAEGRETQLVLDQRFRPFLAQYLTAPQTFS